RHELLDLAADLTARGARPYDPEALRRSLALHNENRALVRRLHALRVESPWKVPASEAYSLLRASLLVPVEESTPMLRAYLEAVEADTSRRPMDQARILLTGSFCEQPPLGLIRTLERSGCYIVDDDFVQVHRWIRGDVPLTGDPLDALVQAFLTDGIESPVRYSADGSKGADLVERVRRTGAEGGVFCGASLCDPALLAQPHT